MSVPSPSDRRGWPIGRMVAGGVIGAILIYPAVSAAIISGGMGHGHYTAARALFPVPMLLTLWTDNHIGDLSIALAFIQFPLYGVLVGATPAHRTWVTWGLILAVHLMAAFVCFSGYIPNSPDGAVPKPEILDCLGPSTPTLDDAPAARMPLERFANCCHSPARRMNILVRQEQTMDVTAVSTAIQRAYALVPFSNHREHLMVERLRASRAFIPELSLVAEISGEIVGHLLLTRITVRDGEKYAASLSLAPLSVVPEFQKRGVGAALIDEAHRRARQLGFRSVIVVGIAGYYQKFGYVPLDRYPIKLPFKVRAENCAIISLCEDGLAGLSGTIEYAPEWMEA